MLDKLAEQIASRGIRAGFGIPGSGASLELLDEMERRGVPFVTTYFEGSAAIMAGTAGRLSNSPGVAVGIKGPGLANMAAGMAACRLDGLPMVGVAEAYPPAAPASKAHKRLDHQRLTSAVAKGRRYLSADGPNFGEMADWSLREAPGPVLLELAGADIGTQDAVPAAASVSAADDISALVTRAQRPLVIAGTLAIRQGWSAALNSLGVPVFSTAAAKGVVDERLPHAAGVYTGVGLERVPEHALLPKADLVIGLGLRSNEVLAAQPFSCAAVNLDTVGDLAPGFDFASTGAATQAGAVFDALSEMSWGQDTLARSKAQLAQYLLDRPFVPAHVFDAALRRFDYQARMVLDTGYFCTIGEHAWIASRADWCLGSGQGRYMGTGLPMAVGAAITDPSVPTLLAIGDGGVAMYLAELRLAVQNNLPLMVLFMTDGGFGSVRTRAINDQLTQKPLLMQSPSWVDIAGAMGMAAVRTDTPGELEKALAQWNPRSGPVFVEIPFDPDLYQEMVHQIR